jgi:hypothetical protein
VGDISRLIAEGLREGGMAEDRISVIYDEAEALGSALASMGDNDLVFVLADDVPAVLSQIQNLTAGQSN